MIRSSLTSSLRYWEVKEREMFKALLILIVVKPPSSFIRKPRVIFCRYSRICNFDVVIFIGAPHFSGTASLRYHYRNSHCPVSSEFCIFDTAQCFHSNSNTKAVSTLYSVDLKDTVEMGATVSV